MDSKSPKFGLQFLTTSVATIALTLGVPSVTQAQEAETDSKRLTTIVVTGSNIRSRDQDLSLRLRFRQLESLNLKIPAHNRSRTSSKGSHRIPVRSLRRM